MLTFESPLHDFIREVRYFPRPRIANSFESVDEVSGDVIDGRKEDAYCLRTHHHLLYGAPQAVPFVPVTGRHQTEVDYITGMRYNSHGLLNCIK